MRLIQFFMRRSRATVVLAILAGVLSGGISAGLIALVHNAMEREGSALAALAWAFAGLCLLQVLAQVAAEVLLLRLTEGTIFELRQEMSRQILATPLRRLEDAGAHRLLATLTGDLRSIADAVTLSPLLFMNLAILAGGFAYMAWLSPAMFLAIFAFMVVILFLYRQASGRGGRQLALAREWADAVQAALRGLTEGTKELKLHRRRRQAFLSDVLERSSSTMKRHTIAGMITYRIAGIVGRIMFLVLIGIVLFVVPRYLRADHHVIDGYVLVLLYMLMPLTALLNSLPTIGAAGVSLRKVERLGLFLAGDELEPTAALPAEHDGRWRSLELAGVTYTYRSERDDHSFVLGPVDLSFAPGELVFLVGGNGSGKTSLAKILVGLYAPEQGEVRLDGKAVQGELLEVYRQLFTMVFSDFYLFDQLLGIDAAGLDERARDYLEKLELDRKLEVSDGRLSTTGLSQGQRKRLALLTAYLEDRAIYVFDEWAADQDPAFKAVFYHQLLPDLKARGKTVLVISHDDHYYDVADRIIKLDFGKVEYDRRLPGLAGQANPGVSLPARESVFAATGVK
jgi:putative ATP-binding cassette transporter